jgi:hypothetical protein
MLQPKADGNDLSDVSDNLEKTIDTARGSGQSLSASTRGSLEPQFGRDFGDVRVHTDANADTLSRRLGAEAFTTGKDVFFKGGAYEPESEKGQKLIAHELAHVVQQSGAEPVIQYSPGAAEEEEELEEAAEEIEAEMEAAALAPPAPAPAAPAAPPAPAPARLAELIRLRDEIQDRLNRLNEEIRRLQGGR